MFSAALDEYDLVVQDEEDGVGGPPPQSPMALCDGMAGSDFTGLRISPRSGSLLGIMGRTASDVAMLGLVNDCFNGEPTLDHWLIHA